MIQFLSYPIYIVYSRHTQESADGTAADFSVKGDRHMYEWMKTTGKFLMQIEEDSAPAYVKERTTYENTIRARLNQIHSTEIGRCIFHALNPTIKVWIHPNPNLFFQAVTYRPRTVKEGGGIRIQINPEDWVGTLDDTLVHELVHALRFSHNRIYPRQLSIGDYPTVEEFLATQISNTYRSLMGKTQLYGTYVEYTGKWASKGTIYSEFVESPLMIMALKYFLDKEPLASRVARLPLKRPDFNPFRDYSILERMALNKIGFKGSRGAGKFMPL